MGGRSSRGVFIRSKDLSHYRERDTPGKAITLLFLEQKTRLAVNYDNPTPPLRYWRVESQECLVFFFCGDGKPGRLTSDVRNAPPLVLRVCTLAGSSPVTLNGGNRAGLLFSDDR